MFGSLIELQPLNTEGKELWSNEMASMTVRCGHGHSFLYLTSFHAQLLCARLMSADKDREVSKPCPITRVYN